MSSWDWLDMSGLRRRCWGAEGLPPSATWRAIILVCWRLEDASASPASLAQRVVRSLLIVCKPSRTAESSLSLSYSWSNASDFRDANVCGVELSLKKDRESGDLDRIILGDCGRLLLVEFDFFPLLSEPTSSSVRKSGITCLLGGDVARIVGDVCRDDG